MRYNRKNYKNRFIRDQIVEQSKYQVQYQTNFLDDEDLIYSQYHFGFKHQLFKYYNDQDFLKEQNAQKIKEEQQRDRECQLAVKYLQVSNKTYNYNRSNFDSPKRNLQSNSVHNEFLNYQ